MEASAVAAQEDNFSLRLTNIFREKLRNHFKVSTMLHLMNLQKNLTKLKADLLVSIKNMQIAEIRARQPKNGVTNTNIVESCLNDIIENQEQFFSYKNQLRTVFTSSQYISPIAESLNTIMNQLDDATKNQNLVNLAIYESKRLVAGTIRFYQLNDENISQPTYQFILSRYLQLFYILITVNDITSNDQDLPVNVKKSLALHRKTSSLRFTHEKLKSVVEQFLEVYPSIFHQFKFNFEKFLTNRTIYVRKEKIN